MLQDIFVIGDRLGIGATAEVFAATLRATGEMRALKVFTPMVLADPDTVKRIEGEVTALATLSHPNIVRLFASHKFGEAPSGNDRDSDELALELEFVDGSDLRAWRRGYELHLHEPVLWILSQVARGIGCAHEHGILHRDLKPENILISKNGEVKLTDFGLARQLDAVTMTKSGLMAGSIGYMAPEMLDGERCTPLSDVFSFGAVAYELLSGVNPFAGPNPQSMMKRMLSGEFRPLGELVPGLPARVESLVHSSLAIAPAARPASIWHVEAELLSALTGSPLHRYCRALVATAERSRTLEPAFLEKLRELEAERAALGGTKAELIGLAREWSYVFPDSAVPAELLAAIPPEETVPVWRRVAAAALLLLFLGSGVWVLRALMRGPAAEAPVVMQDTVMTKAAAPAPAAVAPVPVPVPAPLPAPAPVAAKPKPAPTHGWISVEADDDVKLLVDGEEIPRGQWNRIPADPGRRRIRLVKEGFLPIENVIAVQAGKVSVVRAKGGG